ncbi:MAG: hypothetical protein V7641_2444 [Blastocatellia bacterium]
MKIEDLKGKSILILGLGVEGSATFRFLREQLPDQIIGIADKVPLPEMNTETRQMLQSDSQVDLHLGPDYLSALKSYEIIIKTPGISVADHAPLQQAIEAGKKFTSHTALFFANCPGTIVGITGTKGKGTTSKLTYGMLKAAGLDVCLVGNYGVPPLPLLSRATAATVFVYELSAQQLEDLEQSPHVAVLLNIVADHLDHFKSFERYVEAKRNIARYQSGNDYLIYNAMFPLPRRIASQAASQLIPYSIEEPLQTGAFVEAEHIVFRRAAEAAEIILAVADLSSTLPEPFNLHNVLPAIAVGKLFGVKAPAITEAIKNFQPLEHRFERVGTYRSVTFYNASIATVPEVTIEHLQTLGRDVETLLLGGHERHLDFSNLAEQIIDRQIKTVILFPETGRRIWDAICRQAQLAAVTDLPQSFFIERNTKAESAMREAVEIAYAHTRPGKICLHSPASPSFGIFRDYRQRGELFKSFVRQLATANGTPE